MPWTSNSEYSFDEEQMSMEKAVSHTLVGPEGVFSRSPGGHETSCRSGDLPSKLRCGTELLKAEGSRIRVRREVRHKYFLRA
jgi:hypothetical protein